MTMDDLDLLEMLAERRDRTDLVRLEKSANTGSKLSVLREALKSKLREHKKELIGAGTGAAFGALGTYAAHKKGKKGLSAEQRLTRASKENLKKPSKSDSYAKALKKVITRAAKEKADVSTEHPGKTALIEGIPAGAALGTAVTRMLFRK